MILWAFAGESNKDLAVQLKFARKPVGIWRRRWQESFDCLVSIECREPRAKLRRAIEDVLSDAPRSGVFGKFTAEQITLIMAIACEPPDVLLPSGLTPNWAMKASNGKSFLRSRPVRWADT